MTSLQQRGYDDQQRGTLDAGMMREDNAAGREYRDGTRMARRDAFDGDVPKVAPAAVPPPVTESAPVAPKPRKKPKPAPAIDQGELSL